MSKIENELNDIAVLEQALAEWKGNRAASTMRRIREKMKWETYQQAGDALGLDRGLIWKIEHGKRRMSKRVAERIRDVLLARCRQ